MNFNILHLLVVATLLPYSNQLSLPNDPTYMAAVVEYIPAEGSINDRIMQTTEGFQDIIESEESKDLDIIVFPEHIINNRQRPTFVPDPAENITPCFSSDYDIFLVILSCSTRARGIYVVINVVEKELCGKGIPSTNSLTPCPASGVRLFNTNVVFDRKGRVVSRYRKAHLWRTEYIEHSVPFEPELATFETDFGVTFGHFICFDMLFYEPAIALIRERNITDIIYPTYWFAELPFLGAVQLQEGWAFANNVNLLASNAANPSGRTTGSGIFAGRAGRLAAVINETPQTKILKASVPKRGLNNPGLELPPQVAPIFEPKQTTPRFTEMASFRDYNVDIFTTELLPTDFTVLAKNLCHGKFCCAFDIERIVIDISQPLVRYQYRLGAYYGNETGLIRVDRSEQAVCAIFACTDDQLIHCGRIYPNNINVVNGHYFNKIKISGKFPAANRRLIMPSTLDGVMMPLNVSQYTWKETPNAADLTDTDVQLELITPQNDLLTFAIWANYYTSIVSKHNLNFMYTIGNNNTDGAGGGSSPLAVTATTFIWTLCPLIFALFMQF